MGKGMKAGKKPRAPKMDMKSQMAQMQELQAQMDAVQEMINGIEMSASAGGGAVNVSVNGKHEMTKITISPDALDDVEMLQDLIIAATNEAMRQISDATNTEMSEVTKGINFGF